MEVVDFYVRYLFKRMTHSSGIKVHQVLVFDESDDPVSYCENASTHLSVDDIKKTLRIQEYKIEIRYSIHGKKYRAIIRRDDNIHFPIRKELGVPRGPLIRCATLVSNDGKLVDVTKRILKYAGQNGDFNWHVKSMFLVCDMFPFHNTDDYEYLRIETSTSNNEFSMNDIIYI